MLRNVVFEVGPARTLKFAKRNPHELRGLTTVERLRRGLSALLRLRVLAQDETLVSGVAGRYASALFSLAQDDRQTEAVSQSLAKLDALIAESPDLGRLVRSPVFSANDQLKGLNAVLDMEGIGGIAANFVRLITVKRRLFAAREMIAAYRKLYDASRGVTQAEVTSAIAAPTRTSRRSKTS